MYKFKTKPWVHQLKALDYLMIRDFGALYTDMGSGKTKVFIDLIVNRPDFKTVVVVAPKKACTVWDKQFKIHSDIDENQICNLAKLSTKLKMVFMKETFKPRTNPDKQRIIIVNYDSVWRKPFNEFLLKHYVGVDCVICDESHRIKAPASKCSKYLARLGKVSKNRYLCTGTPLAENPIDVYAQYRFLNPDIFGTNYSTFRDYYENVNIAATANAGYRVLDSKQPYKNLEELKKLMFSCAFYITPDIKLPPKRHIVVHYDVPAKTQKVYQEVKKEGVYECKKGVLEINNALSLVLREQQILSGYVPLETNDFTDKIEKKLDDSRKEELEYIVENISKGEKIVVFAKFRWDFERVKEVCASQKLKYGEISGVQDDYEKWLDGKIDLVAVQYKSGAESIDLTSARYCIFYTHTHSLAQYRQALKRIHRPGQTKPVVYYYLVADIPKIKSVDRQIIDALKKKKEVVDYIVEDMKSHL